MDPNTAAEAPKTEGEAKPAEGDRALTEDELKGKLDLKWYGDSGFKIHFKDKDDEHRNIYIDLNPLNEDCP